jgi:hypothetical protein
MDEARSELAAGLSLDPGFSIASFQSAVSSNNPVYLEQRGRVIAAMRRAGIPQP